MSSRETVTRRQFLQTAGLSAVGLYFGVYALAATKPTTEPTGATGPKPETKQPAEEASSVGLNPNVFVHVAPDGLVTFVCHRSEMGQGIRSSIPVLFADELGADMAHVKVMQADGDKAYGDQNTDGSNSIRGFYDDLRRAAATARMMLVAAAAKRLNVPAESLRAENHFVVHGPSGKKLSFGDLAVEAGQQPIPDKGAVKLRPDKELRRIGKALPLLDGPAFVAGTAPYGADVRVPGMLIAVIARPPVVGAHLGDYDKKAALAVPGVKHVFEMPAPKAPYGFQPWGGVAVVAENTWAAMKGRDALKPEFSGGPNADYSSAPYREALFETVAKPGTVLRNVGDVDAALKSAARTVEARYYVPHLPHVNMEPPTALAHFKPENGGSCELWVPSQNPQAVQTEVARILGIPEARVTVHVTFIGGGFGRKSKADFASEAAYLSKEAGVPVRVQFTRPDDIHNDYLNAVDAQLLTAALDEKGTVTAWRHRTAFPPIGSTFDASVNEPAAGDLQQGVLDVALSVPNVRAEAGRADAHVRVGWLRSVYNIFHAFGVNSFLDELAHARGKDPRENMLEIYGSARKVSLAELGVKDLKNYGQPLERYPVDAGRLRGVIEKATEMSSWKNRGAKKRSFGLAAHRSFNSYTAVVASAVKRDGKLWIDEVWIAADAGLVINPDRVRAQMEGAVINGLSYLYFGGVTHKKGAVEQNNFDGVGLVRMNTAPRAIHVEILRTDNPPGGVGEPGLPPVAPAAANAIFALTGQRIRTFDLRPIGMA